MKSVNMRQEKLTNLYIKILDELKNEEVKFKNAQKEAYKVGEHKTKFNYESYNLVSKNLMKSVIRVYKLKLLINEVGEKLNLPF